MAGRNVDKVMLYMPPGAKKALAYVAKQRDVTMSSAACQVIVEMAENAGWNALGLDREELYQPSRRGRKPGQKTAKTKTKTKRVSKPKTSSIDDLI